MFRFLNPELPELLIFQNLGCYNSPLSTVLYLRRHQTSEQNTVDHYLLVNSHIGSERAHNLRSYIELAKPVTTAE